MKQLCERNHLLRDAPASDSEVSDEDVLRGLATLRQQIQTIALDKTLQLEEEELLLPRHPTPQMKTLSSLWTHSPRKDRLLMIRAALFHILNDRVLSHDMFGVDELDRIASTDRREVEKGLRIFEKKMMECQVPNNTVSDWRSLTLRCIELAKFQGKDIGEKTAEELYAILQPLIVKRAGKSDVDNLRSSIRRLCQDANELRLLMRKSKDDYYCVDIPTGKVLDGADHLACPFGATTGGKNDRSGHVGVMVAFTLFGALVKDPQPGAEKTRVLERAQVIMNGN